MTLIRFFLAWISIGIQSFGGGVATLALIQRMAVDKQKWLSEAEFTRVWAVCQVAPGINLLALTTLVGHRAAGYRGILLGLSGLLLPSAFITVLLTAFYAEVRQTKAVDAALHGIIPATVGLGLWTAYKMARPIFKSSQQEGRQSLVFSGFLIAGNAFLSLIHVPVTVLLIGSAVFSAIFQGFRHSRHEEKG
jgi:chromate transporter